MSQEPLVVPMPSDHPLTAQSAVRPRQLKGSPFVAMTDKAHVLRAVIDVYLERKGVAFTPTQEVDNPAIVMSL